MGRADSADILFGMSKEFYSPDTDETFTYMLNKTWSRCKGGLDGRRA